MASQAVKKAISEAALQYTKPEGKVFEYGTAGVCRRHFSRYSLASQVKKLTVLFLFTVSHECVSFIFFPNDPPPHPWGGGKTPAIIGLLIAL